MLMYLKVFLIGGLFCLIGEAIILKTKLTPARILVVYITAGVILSATGLYAPLAQGLRAADTIKRLSKKLSIALFLCNSRGE